MNEAHFSWSPSDPVRNQSETITSGIRVRVRSFFVPEKSSPNRDAFLYAYRVRVSNEGLRWAQLVSRHWVITDGNGMVQEVRGSGVVGEQPTLEPGDVFEYTSVCPLTTRIGFMKGTFQLLRADGSKFAARIEEFSLVSPGLAN